MSDAPPPDYALLDALDQLVHTDPAQALQVGRLLLRTSGGDQRALALALAGTGRALFELGDVRSASNMLDRAVAAARQSGDADLEFNVAMSASAVAAEIGQIEHALVELGRIGPGNTPGQRGRWHTQRAYVLHHAGRIEEALVALADAAIEFHGAGDDLGQLRLLVNRGLLQLQQGALASAERDLQAADAAADRLGQRAMRAGIASNLGVVYARWRRFREAIEQFRLADAYHSAVGRPGRMVAVTRLDQAETLMHAGLLADAREAIEDALPAAGASGSPTLLGDCQLLAARIHLAFGDLRSAGSAAAEAAVTFELADRPTMVLLSRAVAARAAIADPARSDAVQGAQIATLVAELAGAGWNEAADELRLAVLRSPRMRVEVFHPGGDLDTLRLGAFSTRRDQALSGWYAEALARSAAGEVQAALDACRAGLDVLDEIVAEAESLEARSAAVQIGRDLSQLVIDTAIGIGQPETVLAAAEGTRARALHDEVAERSPHRPLTVTGARRLHAELVESLGTRALVEWVVSGDRVWAVIVDRGGTRLVDVCDRRSLALARDRMLVWLVRAVEQPDASSASAMRASTLLDALLLQPLGLAPAQDLVIVPVDALHGVAWSGLPTLSGRAHTLVPNAQVWLTAERRAALPIESLAFVEGPGLERVEIERAAVAAAYPKAAALHVPRATDADVRSVLVERDLVHLAAHGTFRADHPLLSTLRLHHGEVALYDAVPPTVTSRLVVLSSCEGGRHAPAAGSEVLGPAAVLLARGAAAVLAPLTVVRELECADFVADVHVELGRGTSFGEAVALVRRRWLEDDDLSRWAVATAFTCFGSGSVRQNAP